MVMLRSLISILTSAALVSAHFTLDYPTSRGFSDDDEPTAPCGGFNDITTNRSSFPLSGGKYQIDSHHAQAGVQIVFSRDGTTFSSSPVETYTVTGLGTLCGVLPASALSGYQAGDNVTMQIIYKATSESSALYQCADLTLVSSSETAGSCVNGTGVTVSQLQQSQASGSARASVAGSSAVSQSSAAATSARASSSAPQVSWKGSEIVAGVLVMLSIGAFAL